MEQRSDPGSFGNFPGAGLFHFQWFREGVVADVLLGKDGFVPIVLELLFAHFRPVLKKLVVWSDTGVEWGSNGGNRDCNFIAA